MVNYEIVDTMIEQEFTLINKQLKNKYPAPRQQWSTELFEAATNELETILNTLTRRYKAVLSGKAKG